MVRLQGVADAKRMDIQNSLFSHCAVLPEYDFLWRLVWVCTVCQCPFYGTLDINGLRKTAYSLATWRVRVGPQKQNKKLFGQGMRTTAFFPSYPARSE